MIEMVSPLLAARSTSHASFMENSIKATSGRALTTVMMFAHPHVEPLPPAPKLNTVTLAPRHFSTLSLRGSCQNPPAVRLVPNVATVSGCGGGGGSELPQPDRAIRKTTTAVLIVLFPLRAPKCAVNGAQSDAGFLRCCVWGHALRHEG